LKKKNGGEKNAIEKPHYLSLSFLILLLQARRSARSDPRLRNFRPSPRRDRSGRGGVARLEPRGRREDLERRDGHPGHDERRAAPPVPRVGVPAPGGRPDALGVVAATCHFVESAGVGRANNEEKEREEGDEENRGRVSNEFLFFIFCFPLGPQLFSHFSLQTSSSLSTLASSKKIQNGPRHDHPRHHHGRSRHLRQGKTYPRREAGEKRARRGTAAGGLRGMKNEKRKKGKETQLVALADYAMPLPADSRALPPSLLPRSLLCIGRQLPASVSGVGKARARFSAGVKAGSKKQSRGLDSAKLHSFDLLAFLFTFSRSLAAHQRLFAVPFRRRRSVCVALAGEGQRRRSPAASAWAL